MTFIMKKTIVTTILFAFSLSIFSQTFEVPKDYKLIVDEDYAPYKQDVVNFADWLINTPVNLEQAKRQEASEFFIDWISGSPDTHITGDYRIINFTEESLGFLIVFLSGWAKNTIETKNFKNTIAEAESDIDGIVAGNVAGIEAVIKFYKKNKSLLVPNKNIEKYIKLQEKGKLKKHIQKIVSKSK